MPPSLSSRRDATVSLRRLLLCSFVGIALIPILFLGTWVQHNAITLEHQAVQEKHLLLAKNLSAALSRYATDLEAVFADKSDELPPLYPFTTQTLLQTFNIHMVASLEQKDLTYHMGGSSFLPANGVAQLGTEILQAQTHPQSVIISPVILNTLQEPMLYLLRINRSSKLVIAAVSTAYLQNIQNSISFGQGGHAAIVDQTGQAIAHPSEAWQRSAKNISALKPVQFMLAKQTGVTRFYSPAVQAEMIAGYSFVPETGWGVMIPQPYSELERNAQKTQLVALLISNLGLIFALLISWKVTTYILGPIRLVIQASRDLARGKKIHELPMQSQAVTQEMRTLLQTFNAMAEEVSQARTTLRNKVKERTKDLVKEVEERKNLEARISDRNRQLAITNEELIRATRMKDEFLANMSHELRTPLNAILGMSEGLQENVFGPLNERQREAIKTIESSGFHLLDLINDILDVAKIESGQVDLNLTPIAIDTLCLSSLSFIKQQAAKKSIQIKTEIPKHLPELLLDERLMRQVLINLLNNAVKFTPEQGQITLAVKLQALPSAAENSSSPAYSRQLLNISVIDTGIGIAPEDLGKLFQPFVQIDSTLNRQYTGTGLGLALVKRLVELHGGEVSVTSQLHSGSCFRIEIPQMLTLASKASNVVSPIINENDWQHSPASPPPLSPAKKEETVPSVLLIAENEASLKSITSYLTAKGYGLIAAPTGQAAIALTQTQTPDIILINLQQPQSNTLETLQQMRHEPHLTDLPIVALLPSQTIEAGEQTTYLEAGATQCISQPLQLKQLVSVIQQWV